MWYVVEAIYEDGVLKPDRPLPLKEQGEGAGYRRRFCHGAARYSGHSPRQFRHGAPTAIAR